MNVRKTKPSTDEEKALAEIPRPLLVALRLLLGAVGLFIAWKYLGQLPSGSIEWILCDEDGTRREVCRATTPAALCTAVLLFGTTAFGFVSFALRPLAAIQPRPFIIWCTLVLTASLLLRLLSQTL